MARDIEQMIEDNQKLVYYVLNRHYPAYVADDDIYQAGLIGLWKACAHFDESKGAKFSTFATTCILNEIRMEFRARASYSKRLGMLVSLDEPLYINDQGEEVTIADSLAEERNPYGDVECDITFIESKVNQKYLEMLKLYLDGMTQVEIAKLYGCTRASVSRNISKVRGQLQKYIKIEDYV